MQDKITVEEATYANRLGYSDVNPYEIIEMKTPRKIMVRAMDAELSEDFKPHFIPGGFVGTVVNQREQSYTYTSNEEYPLVAVRLSKKGEWKDKYGNRYSLNVYPFKFYDYNF